MIWPLFLLWAQNYACKDFFYSFGPSIVCMASCTTANISSISTKSKSIFQEYFSMLLRHIQKTLNYVAVRFNADCKLNRKERRKPSLRIAADKKVLACRMDTFCFILCLLMRITANGKSFLGDCFLHCFLFGRRREENWGKDA